MNQDIDNWNKISDNYAELVESDRRFAYIDNYLWDLMGDVNNQNIIDLGCGQGWFSNELKRKNANVIGIDGSRELLKRAKKLYPNIKFIEHDLIYGLPKSIIKQDIIISHMTIFDIKKIDSLFSSISKSLKMNGCFIFTLLHPCFFNQKSYYDEKTKEWYKKVKGYLKPEIWRIESYGGHNHYHRSISTYITTLKKAGMVVSDILEPPQEGDPEVMPIDYIKSFPLFMIIKAIKY